MLALALVLVLGLPLGLAGCAAGSLSATQLRDAAQRICLAAARQADGIPVPRLPSQGAGYLSRGVAALGPELAALRRLDPPGDLAPSYRAALRATASELRALRSTVYGLGAGDDPVVAIKTLQQGLAPLEREGNRAWAAAGLEGCESR